MTASKKMAVASLPASPPVPETMQGESVTLPKRSGKGTPLRLATLSWSFDPGESWSQSSEQFLFSVAAAASEIGVCDLLLAAGMTVLTIPAPDAILAAGGGLPVLFESKKGQLHSWFLAHLEDGRPRLSVVRQKQVVTSWDQYNHFGRLAEIIASGAGVITFDGIDLKLILFICGENNILNSASRASVLKAVSRREEARQRLATILSGPWIVLNPAHTPYYPQSKIKGFAKVGTVRSKKGNAGPTLKWVVQAKTAFRDDTESPLALLHVNNFHGGIPKTARFADVAFGGSLKRVHGPVAGSLHGLGESWRSSVFEVRPGRSRP